MKVYNFGLIANQPMNTNFNSNAQELYSAWGYTIQAVYSSTCAGTFHLEGSADPIDNTPGDSANLKVTNWTTILNSSFTVSSGGSYVWDVNSCGYNYVRLVYVDSSGGTATGICNARINVKGVT